MHCTKNGLGSFHTASTQSGPLGERVECGYLMESAQLTDGVCLAFASLTTQELSVPVT